MARKIEQNRTENYECHKKAYGKSKKFMETVTVYKGKKEIMAKQVNWTKATLKENIDYFKNRNSFEIPVYDTPQFQAILRRLEFLQRAAFNSVESERRHM